MTREEKIDRLVDASRSFRYMAARQIGTIDAEDVIQESLVLCIEAADEIRKPEAFLATVVRRQISALIKRRQRERNQLLPIMDEPRRRTTHQENVILKRPGSSVLDELIRADIIQVGLAGVDARDREVLTRAYLAQQDARDIMAAMDLSKKRFDLLKNRAKDRFTASALRGLRPAA